MFEKALQDSIAQKGDRSLVKTVRTSYTGIAQRYGQELNYGARSFYLMTKDNVYLKKALQWAAYANQFYESPYALDTWEYLPSINSGKK